jgi:UDP-2-acetamido-2-deoxy-ribo-hexuluronate aminotransferase
MEFIDLKAQYRHYRAEIDARLRAVLDHGKFILGPEVALLEAQLARFAGVRHALTVASGTHGLELALRALGIGAGDEVITVSFTWISTVEAIALVGARPVFVDIEPTTFNMDPSRIEAAITARSRAILPVSLFGQMPDYTAIAEIAARHGLVVIEDAAQSFGATRHGTRSCAATLVGCTSFYPAKPLGCYGDGGALFTDDDALALRLRALRTHGSERPGEHVMVGTNARFDTMQAAVLLAKLPHFPSELQRRARLAARYSNALGTRCVVPVVAPGNTHTYAQYTIRAPARDGLALQLNQRGIPSAIHYRTCVHEQPAFRGSADSPRLPESERAAREVLSLPLHAFLEDGDQDRVIEAVLSGLESAR